MAIVSLPNSLPRTFYGEKMPTKGTFKIGDRVVNTKPTAANPIGYWLRVTDGNTHVLDTDWIAK